VTLTPKKGTDIQSKKKYEISDTTEVMNRGNRGYLLLRELKNKRRNNFIWPWRYRIFQENQTTMGFRLLVGNSKPR